jgi:hypothetical protein
MRAEDPDRLTGLHQQGFVFFKIPQRGKNGVKGLPERAACPRPAVDHQAIWVFGNRWIEVVLDHAVSRFDQHQFLQVSWVPVGA